MDPTLPDGALVLATLLSAVVSTLILASFHFRTFRLSRGDIRRRVTNVERRIAIVHYFVCAPLFEIFVIWGAHLDMGIAPCAPTAVLVWIAVLLAQAVALLVAYCSARNYRMVVHVAQIMQLPCVVVFFVDRLVHDSIGIEGSVLSAIVACGVIEVYSVPDFFRRELVQTAAMSADDEGGESHFLSPTQSRFIDEEVSEVSTDSVMTSEIGLPVSAMITDKRRREQVVSEVLKLIVKFDLQQPLAVFRDLVATCKAMIQSAFPPSLSATTTDSDRDSRRQALPRARSAQDTYVSPRTRTRRPSRNYENSFDNGSDGF